MHNVKRLLGMLKPYTIPTLAALITMMVFTALDYLIPFIFREILDNGVAMADMAYLKNLILIMLAVVVLRTIALYFQNYFMEYSGQKVAFDLRNKLYEHMQRLSFGFFDKHHTGQIMSRMTGDIDCIRNFLGQGFINMLVCIINFTFTVIIYFVISWKIALFVMLPTPFLVIIILKFGKKIRPAWEEVREQIGKLTAVLQENVTGVRVVKAFSREVFEKGKFNVKNTDNFDENIKRAEIEADAFPVMELISGLNFLLLTVSGGYYVINGEITVGTFVALQWLIFGLIWPIRFMGWLVNLMQQASAAAPRIFEITDTLPDIVDGPVHLEREKAGGNISFENVSFSFSDGTNALKNIDLNIEAGQTVAFIGGTGSGKSTLIGLLPRFYDPSKGKITIDGIDIKSLNLKSLRDIMAIVQQETFLFSDTIRENIAYGKPSVTEEEIINAAKTANIHDFIMSLEKGYDTRVGERGVGLSGGQKQRIAIARALITQPVILILDEATSSVDTSTERAIQKSMKDIITSRTTLIIAQRLSTVKHADKVIVMEDGAVVASGTHEELMGQKDSYYGKIYNMQFKYQEQGEAI